MQSQMIFNDQFIQAMNEFQAQTNQDLNDLKKTLNVLTMAVVNLTDLTLLI